MNSETEEESAEDREFAQAAGAVLRRGVANTPPKVRARLDRMVDRAMRPRATGSRYWGWIAWPVGVASVSSLVLALIFAGGRGDPQAPQSSGPAADDLALLLNVDNLDLLEQMEFYQWLDRQPALLEAGDAQRGQRS